VVALQNGSRIDTEKARKVMSQQWLK